MDKCVICLDVINSPKELGCGHKFCEVCIDTSFRKYQPKCPSCGRLFGTLVGNQPPGTMSSQELPMSLPGYPQYKTIQIVYQFGSGIQGPEHPNPGHLYGGTQRVAYLPASPEGHELLKLLRRAFDARLVFTIGRSVTTGVDNIVVWNDLHHKTSFTGPYGYPDPTYMSRLKEELANRGIVP